VGVNTKWATSDKKVKEKREDKEWPGYPYTPSLDDDPRIKFKGTPIGDLTKDDPLPGSYALGYLFCYARMGNDPDFVKSELGNPTGENLIKFFISQMIGQDNAKKYLDILVNYKSKRKAIQKLKKKLRDLNKKKLKTNREAALKRHKIRAQILKLSPTPKVLVKLYRYPDSIDPLYYVNRRCYKED
jgi:hypothetical protein